MRFLMFLAIFFTFVFSVNAQSEKFIDVVYASFYINSPIVSISNNISNIESVPNGSVMDANQSDYYARTNSSNHPYGSLTINFKNVSQKKIKSISYLFEYTDGKKVFYKNKYKETLNLNPNENKKIRRSSQVSSVYLASAKGVERITIKKIEFADRTSIKF